MCLRQLFRALSNEGQRERKRLKACHRLNCSVDGTFAAYVESDIQWFECHLEPSPWYGWAVKFGRHRSRIWRE